MQRQRKSQLKRVIKEDLSKEVKKAKQDAKFNWNLASTYWDRWRHEVEEQCEFQTQRQPQETKISRIMLELPPSHFSDLPADEEAYLGHGSFGTVRRCLYRGINVAVKEYFAGISKEMIQHEASFLFKLCHLSIPLLFGKNTLIKPYYIVV